MVRHVVACRNVRQQYSTAAPRALQQYLVQHYLVAQQYLVQHSNTWYSTAAPGTVQYTKEMRQQHGYDDQPPRTGCKRTVTICVVVWLPRTTAKRVFYILALRQNLIVTAPRGPFLTCLATGFGYGYYIRNTQSNPFG